MIIKALDNQIMLRAIARKEGKIMIAATHQMKELGTNRQFKITGTANTRSEAVNEANAHLLLVTATLVSSKVSEPYTATDAIPVSHPAGTQFSDAVIVLRKAGTTRVVAKKIDNIDVSYADATRPGKITLSNIDIVSYATFYRDANGDGGYVVEDGYFIS